MVKEIREDKHIYLQCEECKFLYRKRKWADKCEAWCKEHHSCNIEIIAHAVKE